MDFSALYTQYGGMTAPACTLEVAGRVLPAGADARLLRTVCELTCRSSAGYLQIQAELDPDGENGSVWLSSLQVGAPCAFSLGYGTARTQVFCGFLYDVTWDDPLTQGAMVLEAVFLDVRGRLMAASRADAGRARTLSQLLQTILGQSCCTQLARSRTIGTIPADWDLPVQRTGASDYDVLAQAAAWLCYEFYAWGSELYFGPPRPNATPTVTFSGTAGLMKLQRRRTLAHQCAAVSVSGADDKGQRIFVRQARRPDSGFGTGSMAAALSCDLHQPEPSVRTMAQAKYLAAARMEERQRRAGGVTGLCLGIPELRPGRFIEVSGLSTAANGTFYVHTVRHTLDARGFATHFETEE